MDNRTLEKLKKTLPDVQSQKIKGLHINRVGVDNIHFPLFIKQKQGGVQSTDASFSMYGSLLHNVRGVSMSRFAGTLVHWVNEPLSPTDFKAIACKLQKKVEAEDVYVAASFKYFLKKIAPVSKKEFMMDYKCKFIGLLHRDKYRSILQICVPVMTFCPCSKELSLVDREKGIGLGAHNQRAEITVQVQQDSKRRIWLEDLIPMVETCGSCPVYPLLKRPDEKYVTEEGYNHPKFVEDVVRDTSIKLQELPIRWFRVKVLSYESIHPSECSSYISRIKKGRVWRKSNASFY